VFRLRLVPDEDLGMQNKTEVKFSPAGKNCNVNQLLPNPESVWVQ